jgi:hypothetical protein
LFDTMSGMPESANAKMARTEGESGKVELF